MYKTVSRDSVIKALKTEPLRRGYWFRIDISDNVAFTPAEFHTCEVCPVGAILRRAAKVKTVKDAYSITAILSQFGRSIKERLHNKQYLSALSLFFESQQNSDGVTPAHRRELIKFVRKNFPKRISVYE